MDRDQSDSFFVTLDTKSGVGIRIKTLEESVMRGLYTKRILLQTEDMANELYLRIQRGT